MAPEDLDSGCDYTSRQALKLFYKETLMLYVARQSSKVILIFGGGLEGFLFNIVCKLVL